jgi:23S rRNA (uridine2552-2'-O)-methyltransferase
MKLHEARQDYYRKLARERGYKSRAAFKVKEVIDRYRLVRRGDRVVDLGAAPGGWLQVVSSSVGPRGLVIGVDTSLVKLKLENVMLVQADVYEESLTPRLLEAAKGKFDVVLSDLSPSVTGAWDLDTYRQADLTLRVLSLCDRILRPGGSGFFKVFDGERTREVFDEMRKGFAEVRRIKPHASRNQASEMYYLCTGWRGARSGAGEAATPEADLTASTTSA